VTPSPTRALPPRRPRCASNPSPARSAPRCTADLAQDLDEATMAAIRRALPAHCVIFFRDQHLDIARQ